MKTTKELEVLIEIVERVDYFKRLKKYHEDDLNKPVYYFMSGKLKHKIDIYDRCIGRLTERYEKLIK